MFGRVVNISYFLHKNFHLMQSSPKKPQGKHSSTKGKRFDSKENTTNQKRKTSSGKENFSSDRKKATTGREKTPYRKEKPPIARRNLRNIAPLLVLPIREIRLNPMPPTRAKVLG